MDGWIQKQLLSVCGAHVCLRFSIFLFLCVFFLLEGSHVFLRISDDAEELLSVVAAAVALHTLPRAE
jgi:hypothetical protein